jgi:hypothetical protein
MENTTTRFLRPQYTIKFVIGQKDLTMRLQNLSIINSIKTIYPVFLIKLQMSSKDYFLEQIYGQEDAKLDIVLTTESSTPLETTSLDLIIIHMDNKVSMQKNTEEDTNESNQLEDTVIIIALLKEAYLSMSTSVNMIVNKLSSNNTQPRVTSPGNGLFGPVTQTHLSDPTIEMYEEAFGPRENWTENSKPILKTSNIVAGDDPLFGNITSFEIGDFFSFLNNFDRNSPFMQKPILDAIRNLSRGGVQNTNFNSDGSYTPAHLVHKLFDRFIKNNAQKNIKMSNLNSVSLDNVVIPPRSFIGAIRYINDRYGIYKGPLFAYYDLENKFNMWDLSTVSNYEKDYTVEFLSSGQADREILNKSGEGDNHFYTYFPLHVKNKTNASLMSTGYEHIISKSPRNKLFKNIILNVEEVLNKVSMSGNPNILCNPIAKTKRTVHSTSVMGNDEDDDNAFATSKLSQYMASASLFKFRLKGTKIPIKKLSRVGGCIELIPHVAEYLKYSGNYIVGSSVISLTRESTNHYMCFAEVTCFRESLES